MNLLIKTFLTLLTIVLTATLQAQIPSQFKLGEDELSGIDIYDVIQDADKNYWLATDDGLIKYDGYNFKKIKCDNALSNSVFDLKFDYTNTLYCKNLSGQIFQINNDSCKVYFQIPDSLMYKNVLYAFDANNRLTIVTNTIFKVHKDKSITLITNPYFKNSYTDLIVQQDSSLLLYELSNNLITTIENEKLVEKKIQFQSDQVFLNFLYFDKKIHYINKETSNFLTLDNQVFTIDKNFFPSKTKNERLRYYATNEYLWGARQAGGVTVYNFNFKPLFNNKILFKNIIISKVYQDIEGNILLGTFGDGLIVLPNINLEEVNITQEEIRYTRITSDINNNIFIGTQNGSVYRLDNNLKSSLIWGKKSKNIEILEYFKENNSLLIDGSKTFLFSLNTKEEHLLNWGSIKDVTPISESNYLFASNSGIYNFNTSNYKTVSNPINNFKGRTFCVNINPETKTIYAGTASGLKIGNKNTADFFLFNGATVICRDILFYKNKIYITTKTNGILIFENDKLTEQWSTKNNLPTNNLKHIKSYQDHFYISTDVGIIITDITGKTISTLSKTEGLYSNNITDFEISNGILWLIHQKGIQKINIKDLTPTVFKPFISITKILVNDSLAPITNSSYTFNRNKFEFFISSNSIKYKNEIQYLHQLVGIDDNWQFNTYANNKIEYKSLPPGNYIFKVKAKCRNKESEVINYKFKIQTPFWDTWWFYLIIMLLFASIIYTSYKYQIKKQKRKIQLENELIASKLIAIKSQMNPHFIFNAINSIQDLILKGDINNSYSYVIKFSKLVRQTLNFSDKEFIDIEEEIDLLKIYLELEKLRFKNDFEYTIINELSDFQVPPMLVQPFVENAIKHGLLHKEGLKKLTITFNKDTMLYCTITDNGIGRKKAQEIRDRRQKNHQSFSVNATRNRFEIMKTLYQQNLGVQFKDLIENEKAIGTTVIINMPFKQSY